MYNLLNFLNLELKFDVQHVLYLEYTVVSTFSKNYSFFDNYKTKAMLW